MAITTTTSRSNVDALLRTHLGEHWAQGFAVTICGEDVLHKKPAADVYLQALRMLAIQPCEVLAIEDAPAGAAAARAADMPFIITRSVYFADAPIEHAMAIGPGLQQRGGWQPALQAAGGEDRPVDLDDIENWRRRYRCGERTVAHGA